MGFSDPARPYQGLCQHEPDRVCAGEHGPAGGVWLHGRQPVRQVHLRQVCPGQRQPGEDHGQVSLSVTGHIRWVIFGLCEHLLYNFLFQNQSQVTEYGWDGPELIQRNNVPAWKVKMVIL